MTTAEAKLAAARNELLDLGLRNPLLNYRPLKARGATVIDEKSAEIFKLLVQKRRSLTFEPKLGLKEEDQTLAQPEDNGRFTDSKLQTPYGPAALQKRLITTAHAANTTIEERGVNVLYLALGMLRWSDRDTRDETRFAPLILVPVYLARPSANARYRLTYSGTEVVGNLSLEARLRIDFGLALPPLPDEDALEVEAYFDALQTAVSQQPGWQIERNNIALAFFSFSKLFMINDLDPASWPVDRHPAHHSVLNRLLSDDAYFEPLPVAESAAPLDLHGCFHVVDADSSQTEALRAVQAGESIVIQGPPGTGKSQTITNIIADALGRGRSVLFVSEKMAALDVVKRRLDEAGIGDAALQLHSHRTTKAELMDELQRMLTLGQPKPDPTFADLDELERLQHHLNAYAEAVNSPIGASGVSPHEAVGRIQQLERRLGKTAKALPRLHMPAMANWNQEVANDRRVQITELETMLHTIGHPKAHPFCGARATRVNTNAPAQIRRAAQDALDALKTYTHRVTVLAELLHQPAPHSDSAAERLVEMARHLLDAPTLYAVNVADPLWRTDAVPLRRALQAGVESHILRERYGDWLIPTAWQADLAALRPPLHAHGDRWLSRIFSGAYRRARSALRGYCRDALPKDPSEVVALVDAVLTVQGHASTIAAQEETFKRLFGVRWQGAAQSDWFELNRVGSWLTALHEDVANGRLPQSLLDFLATGFDYRTQERLKSIDHAVQTARSPVHAAFESLAVFQPGNLPDDFAAQRQKLAGWLQAAERYGEMVSFNRLAERLRSSGLGEVIDALEDDCFTDPALRRRLLEWFDWCRFSALYDKARLSREPLAHFDAEEHTAAAARFAELDQQFLEHNRIRLSHAHWERLPGHKPTGLVARLFKESSKKRNHMPIRQLIREMGRIVQQIKPIWMMSPLSIAMYLPPGALDFDLVVFDEASQVRPVEAFGAILRGRQVVVVGDSQQLPPTPFFDRVLGDASDDETFDDERESITAQNESILDLFVDRGAPQRMLRWHYRSRHESLIAISNREFYDEQLMLFPSPDAMRRDLGLKLHHLPNSVYDRGKTRTNPEEAAAVAQAVIQHANETPELTLGVAAFSAAQREAIALEVEKLRRATPDAESFFRAHPTEPFFVKNLENVQGDERDVVLISVGYGRSVDGSVSLNFGPLNGDGGERRLNVLMTRARRRCIVFTNLRAADIDLRRSDAAGVAALKAVLAYAETGQLSRFAPQNATRPGPLADHVATVLREAGYDMAQNVGHNGVTIDVAVARAGENGRFSVGILCDGASYAQALSARDRERIQPTVLTALGWRTFRVWSADWIKEPKAAAQRLLKVVANVLQEGPIELLPQTTTGAVPRYAAKPLQPRLGLPYEPSPHRFTLPDRYEMEPPPPDAVDAFLQIVADEGPIHMNILRLRFRFAIAGVPKDIEPLWRSVAQHSVAQGKVEGDGEFYRSRGETAVPLRSRDTLPAHQRKFEYVSNWELDAALCQLVRDAVAIDPLDLIPLVFALFGYGNLSTAPQRRVFDRIVVLLRQGQLHFHDEWVTLPYSHSVPAGQRGLDALAQKRPKFVPRVRARTKLEKLIEQNRVALAPYQRFNDPLILREDGWQLSADRGEISLRYVATCRFDVEPGRFVEPYPYPAYFRTDYQDIGVSDQRVQPITALVGSFGYDLIRGRFFYNGFLGAVIARTLRPDRLIRVWRDPESGALLVRRAKPMEEKLYKPFFFTHPTERLDPTTGELTPIDKRVVANEPHPVDVHSTLGSVVLAFERCQFDALVAAESPIHIDRLTQRYETELGLRWPVVKQMVERIVAEGEARGSVRRDGAFVWDAAMKRPKPRSRADQPEKWRKMAYVAPEEIAEAVRLILQAHPSLEHKLLVGMAAYHLLGKKRLGKVEGALVTDAIDALQSKIDKINPAVIKA